MFKEGDLLVPSQAGLELKPERIGKTIVIRFLKLHKYGDSSFDGTVMAWDSRNIVGATLPFQCKYWQLQQTLSLEDCM